MLLQDQKRFIILEVAADRHELIIPQRTMRPSIARANEQLDPRFAGCYLVVHWLGTEPWTFRSRIQRPNH